MRLINRKQKIITIVTVVAMLCLWLLTENNDEIVDESKKQDSIKYDKCRSQFNEEFNYPKRLDALVPFSIFHRDDTITIILSQNKFTPGTVLYAQEYNVSIQWKNIVDEKTVVKVNCKVKESGKQTALVVVNCKLDNGVDLP